MKRLLRILTVAALCGALASPTVEARGNRGSRPNTPSHNSGGGRGDNGGGRRGGRAQTPGTPSAPSNPGNHGGNRPSNPGNHGGNRPNNPGNINGNHGGNRPGNSDNNFRPGNPGGNRPGDMHPGGNRPNNPGNNFRPGNPGGNRPGNPGGHRPGDMGHRPPHPSHQAPPPPRPPRPSHMAPPPHRPHYHSPWAPPRPPRGWRPGPLIPTFSTILGITFGTGLDLSLNYLYNNGYSVYSYGNNAIYLNNVNQLNLFWPDAVLYYGNGILDRGQFIYSTSYYDTMRYNDTYSRLVAAYGAPISVAHPSNGIQASWFGNDGRFVTLQYQPTYGADGVMRYYTTLSFGF